jgi:hypothetical protein
MSDKGGLGGSILGLFGFGSWTGAQFLGTDGLNENPDGKPSASRMNLLINATDNYEINDAGDVLLIND